MKQLKKTYSYKIFLKTAFFSAMMLQLLVGLIFASDTLSTKRPLLSLLAFGAIVFTIAVVFNFATCSHRGFWQFMFVAAAIVTCISATKRQSPFFVFSMFAFSITLFFKLVTKWLSDFKLMEKLLNISIPHKTLIFDQVKLYLLAILGTVVLFVFFDFFMPKLFPKYGAVEFQTYLLLFYISAILSIHYSLIQPFDFPTMSKLEAIDLKDNPMAVASLENKLVKKHKRKYGVQIIASILRPFFSIKVYGRENVDKTDFPCIFICNHYEVFGPAASVLFLPFQFRPWVNAEIVQKELTFDHIYNNTMKRKKMPDFMRRFFTKVMCKLGNWAINSFEPIPVYKGNVKDVIKTIQTSVTALSSGDNLLIFPENPIKTESGKYERDSVGELYTGFAHMGKAYFKETGKEIPFYPVFVDKKNRRLLIGEGVRFNSKNNPRDEKLRIATLLSERLNDLVNFPKASKKKKK